VERAAGRARRGALTASTVSPSGGIAPLLLLCAFYARRKNYRSFIVDSSASQGKIKLALARVDTTVLAQFQYEMLIPGGPTRNGPWTDVTRVYQRPDGYPVFLTEFDFVAEGGSVTIMKELINAKVGKSPATLSVQHSSDGRAITELTWETKRKLYSLKTWGDLMRPAPGSIYNRKWLLDIAEGLKE
jgi:hypothetical protein